uniref:Uncharacterized protein n=1 Tax=Meleagris gallopavo TaxID=9103 RepID=A0A803XM07_MELGA
MAVVRALQCHAQHVGAAARLHDAGTPPGTAASFILGYKPEPCESTLEHKPEPCESTLEHKPEPCESTPGHKPEPCDSKPGHKPEL